MSGRRARKPEGAVGGEGTPPLFALPYGLCRL